MVQNDLNILRKIDATIQTLPYPVSDGACIQERDQIADELLENEQVIPNGTQIFSCDYESPHDPHHWIEILLSNGEVYIWDRTTQKLKNQHFLPLSEAQKIWPHYAEPSHKLQIIPALEE